MSDSASTNSKKRILNPPTERLIRYRCETEVRGRILRWAGLPVGATGAFAFLVAMFIAIKDQVENLELPGLAQDALRVAAVDALTREAVFRDWLDVNTRGSVAAIAREHVEAQLRALASENVQATLASAVTIAIPMETQNVLIRNTDVQSQLAGTLQSELRSDDHRLLLSAIQSELESFAVLSAQRIYDNLENIVEASTVPLAERQIINKDTYATLERRLNELRNESPIGADFALRFYIGLGQGEYEANAILDYLINLGRELREDFRFVLVLYDYGQFIALATPEQLLGILQDQSGSDDLLALLNGHPSLHEAKDMAAQVFGPASIEFLVASRTVKDEIVASIGRRDEFNRQMPVVDGNAEFLGLTTRRQMIESLLARPE